MRLPYQKSLYFVLLFLAQTLHAEQGIAFKKPLSHAHGVFVYSFLFALLLIGLLVLTLRAKSKTPTQTQCRILEKKHLSTKTVLYVIEHQQQRFLLADNQHALVLHPLEKEGHHEAP